MHVQCDRKTLFCFHYPEHKLLCLGKRHVLATDQCYYHRHQKLSMDCLYHLRQRWCRNANSDRSLVDGHDSVVRVSKMRLSILHDEMGNVLGLVASPPDAPISYLEANAGQFTTVVDMTEEMRTLKASEIHARLSDIIENYKVEMPTSQARLVQKSKSRSGKKS